MDIGLSLPHESSFYILRQALLWSLGPPGTRSSSPAPASQELRLQTCLITFRLTTGLCLHTRGYSEDHDLCSILPDSSFQLKSPASTTLQIRKDTPGTFERFLEPVLAADQRAPSL